MNEILYAMSIHSRVFKILCCLILGSYRELKGIIKIYPVCFIYLFKAKELYCNFNEYKRSIMNRQMSLTNSLPGLAADMESTIDERVD